jgi:1-acyl-sn-glycerol-3-phosphate acyltransferase
VNEQIGMVGALEGAASALRVPVLDPPPDGWRRDRANDLDAREHGLDAHEHGLDAHEHGLDAHEHGLDAREHGLDAHEHEVRHQKRHAQKSSVLRWLHPDGVEWGANVAEYDPAAVERARRVLGMLFGERRYFGLDVRGWEHVPASPAMVVSNHSGGTLILDTWGLCYAWYTHFGTERPLHPAAHEMVLGNRFTGSFFARRGVIRADRDVARRVLSKWRQDLLVMPGGDLDVWRPFAKRYEVCFAGRTGYARLALSAGMPVVPVAHIGAHETLVVLSDGQRIARKLRLRELARANIWPIHLSLPWGFAVGPWPHLPLPTRMRYRFAPAIWPHEVDARPGVEPTDDQVEELDRRVRARMQEQLDRIREERRARR